MVAPPGPRQPPPGRPDPEARRIIDQIAAYVAGPPSLARAHGARAIAAAALEQADVATVAAHDQGGVKWPELARAFGLKPGSVNQAATRVRARRQLEQIRGADTA